MTGLKTPRLLIYLAAAALAVGLGLWVGHITDNTDKPLELQLQGGTALGHLHRRLPGFELIDGRERPFTRESLEGQWTLMFFGYTHCPDICPMTLAVLAGAWPELAKLPAETDGRPVRVVFVSVDPQRDDPGKLSTYTGYFNPEFIGVTGPETQIRQLTDALGILYAKVPDPNNPDNYLVDHSASILVINPRAELEAVLSAPHSAPVIAADLRRLITRYDRG